ncbi:hypothetical protein BSZ21_23885 [Bradyrhizobium canariense]|nr:hypothetical protein BSZ21_23885 [Bradyrhizobium canariense]
MRHDRPQHQTVDAKFLRAIILLLDALQIEGGCGENLKRGATSRPHNADEINTDGAVRVAIVRLLRAYIAAIGQSDRARAALLERLWREIGEHSFDPVDTRIHKIAEVESNSS